MPADIAAMMRPAYVAPGVAFLASEDAPTGVTLNIGAGLFGVTVITENPGYVVPAAQISAETIAANWTAVSDRTTLTGYDNALDQSMAVIAHVKK